MISCTPYVHATEFVPHYLDGTYITFKQLSTKLYRPFLINAVITTASGV